MFIFKLKVLDIIRPSFKQTINQQLKANSTVFFFDFFFLLQINVEKIKDWHFNWQKSFIFNKTMLLLCCFFTFFFYFWFLYFVLFNPTNKTYNQEGKSLAQYKIEKKISNSRLESKQKNE